MTLFSLLLITHVAFAGAGLAAGYTALLSPKGGPIHRAAGRIFLVTMAIMTAIALTLALLHADLVSIVPSMLTFYLVATGWRTLATAKTSTGLVDALLFVLALVAGTTGYALGVHAAQTAGGADDRGFPSAVYFIFGSVCFLAGALDLRVLLGRGLRGGHRLARHIWRMGAAMFIAATSFFQGQEQVFPKALHGTLLLKAPAYLVIGMTLYWLARLLIRRPPGASLFHHRMPAPRPSARL